MAAINIVLVLFLCTEQTTGTRENVALNKPATASSILPGSYPGLAVDGNTVTSWYTCMHTGLVRSPAWWKVDLQRVVQDPIVKIYFNRCDVVLSTNQRRNGVQQYTSTTDLSSYLGGQLCHTVTGKRNGTDIPDVVTVVCSGRWRYVMIYTNTMTLDVGEVEVWACSNNKYGANCTHNCSSRHCAVEPTSCDRYTGVCPTEKCKVGYRGIDCAEACSSGRYGPDCNMSCSIRKCIDFTSCDHVTGECTGGCQPGWNGYDCTQTCLSGTYGDACSKLCTERHCNVSSVACDHVTGVCPAGDCLTGWTRIDCVQVCPSGTYGPECSFLCGNCTGDDICNHETGNCPGSCKLGWRGIQCNLICQNNSYGVNCAVGCGQCNDMCDRVTGHCPEGCKDGYNGIRCDMKLVTGHAGQSSEFQSFRVVAAVLGTLSALVLMTLIIVFFVCIWRKRKRSELHDNSGHINTYYNTTIPNVRVRNEWPETNTSPVLPPTEYAMGATGTSYTTINDMYGHHATSRTYDCLTRTSKDMDNNYSEVQPHNVYENVSRDDQS